MSQYRYGLQKRHYRAGDRENIKYPHKKCNDGLLGKMPYYVVDYCKEKKLPKDCYFNVLSYDGYTMHLKTQEYENMSNLPLSYDLCPNSFVSVGINEETGNVVEISFLEPEYLGLGEYSEYDDVLWVLSAITKKILEQTDALEMTLTAIKNKPISIGDLKGLMSF